MAFFRRNPPRLRIGTRASKLALVQVNLFRAALRRAAPELDDRVEVMPFATDGDHRRDVALEVLNAAQGGRGVFSDELDAAVAGGAIDVAVHSVKDTPPVVPTGLVLAATLERADPREAFVSFRHRTLADVPPRTVFGSASQRRQALLAAVCPHADFALLRGNVEERVAQVRAGTCDGTILAVAGLARLDMTGVIAEILPPEVLMPDPGQGAIGIVCARDNLRLRRILASIDHAPTHAAIDAERAALQAIGCAAPVGALARVHGDNLVLDAVVAPRTGGALVRGRIDGPVSHAESLGRVLGLQLKSRLEGQAAA
jgi:hydroxymethylbilane synthase